MPRTLIRPGLAVLSALFLVLSFPLPDWGWMAWFAWVPLLAGLEGCSRRGAFALGYLAGYLFFLGTIYWIAHVSVPGLFVLVAYLALYPALFALGAHFFLRLGNPFLVFLLPSLWVALELARAHLLTGFPWALAGYTQYQSVELIQISNGLGSYGVSWLVLSVNAGIFLSIRRRSVWPITLAGLFLFGAWVYGLSALKSESVTGPRVAVVQGNIPQVEKWNPAYAQENIDKYVRLTRVAVLLGRPQLVIWPETAFPGTYPQDPESHTLSELAVSLETPLLIGAPVWQEGRATNSAVLLSAEGEVVGRYDKIHLVPFGEYLPLGSVFSFLRTYDPRIGTFLAGEEPIVFDKAPIPLSVLICFEDLFPDLVRRFVRRGARLLVNITNDAWFGDTAAPHQHLQSSVFRAVENGVGVVRAANTGVSAVIDPWGRVTGVVHEERGSKRTFIEGSVQGQVASLKNPTLYSRIGDLFAWGCLAFTLLAGLLVCRRNLCYNKRLRLTEKY